MREADVDLSLSLMDGRIALAEVKSDRHLGRSGNLLFEILRINHTAPHGKAVTLGWSARSPANWLLYFSPAKHAIYQITFDSFREGFQKYTEACRAGTEIRVDWTNTDKIKSTINVLVPEKYFTGIVIHRL